LDGTGIRDGDFEEIRRVIEDAERKANAVEGDR
jgi:hypothetical protein